MRTDRVFLAPFAAFVALALAPAAAWAQVAPALERIVIGSKNFSESHLLGAMMAQLLEAHTGARVEHRAGLGGTLVCFEALKSGQIDLYPDYTGTAWSVVLKEPGRVADPMRTYLRVQSRFRAEYDLEWLQPFGFNNTYAIAMRRLLAEELNVHAVSDLATKGGSLRAGFSHEFVNREDGWAGLAPFYGLTLGSVRGMEHALAYEALAASAIDIVDAYSTDGKLLRYDLHILADDRGFFPPYHAAPIVRGALLRAHPEVREVLERLAYRLPDTTMIRLNYQVEVEGRGFDDVARAFLVGEGLLDPGSRAPGIGADRTMAFIPFFIARWRTTLGLIGEHLVLTFASVLLAAAFAIPLGIWITRHRIAERISLGAAGIVQTIPSLALLAVMIAVPGLGLSVRSAIAALFLYALLPILRNTFAGLRDVDPSLIDAARGMGLTERQILLRIQLPIATRTVMAGLRTSTVISIGVATLAAFIGAGGLGEPIVTGLYLNDTNLILAGAVPAALLALAADFMLGRLERRLTPRGLR
jgi:osmoprotectant transport system permease protein